jgi:phosphatidylinositol phospholipase C delta
MTSKISFKEIIKALKLFVSFHPDTFPLILSFENHCSLPFQEIMAEQLQSILGKSLYIPKEENLLLGRLPSPMEYVSDSIIRDLICILHRLTGAIRFYCRLFIIEDSRG